ncbi:MAG TPA: molecular chaperone HtpG, partial [Alphaproteobacteria bacterium]|nr:molecular chaperone HtpG [Alphaproteobacteria bacterium]
MSESANEKHAFQAEVSRLLHMMINSVYSEREIFLRELISNASDACDKLRYLAITDPSLQSGGDSFRIDITLDKQARLITIADNGVGMSHDELIENLGTIAHSGTGKFVDQLTGDASADIDLIGQFGVGFYSAFMVAEHVDVLSRRAGSEEAWAWQSGGTGEFEMSAAQKPAPGTEIRLHIRAGEDEFLDPARLRQVISAYSDHVAHPIYLHIAGEADA